MNSRRTFIKNAAAAGLITAMPDSMIAFAEANSPKEKIWASLIHLSFNMWEDNNYVNPENRKMVTLRQYDPVLRVSEPLWNDSIKKMAAEKLNMVVIDLGDGVIYDSHPEIAVKNAWTTSRLRAEVAKLRKMGLEPIPKLNFSTAHDTWLKDYSKMVSTETYYKVCKELIAEVVDIFGKPRLFHIGYDEETANDQRYFDYAVIRQHDLWWKDFHFFVDEVEKHNARAWIWSDMAWHNPDVFFKKMPKSVVQSNWYYDASFDKNDMKNKFIQAYLRLEKEGYDQIPCGGYFENWWDKFIDTNIIDTVKLANENFTDSRFLGFLHTSWRPTTEPYRATILDGLELTGDAKKWYKKNRKKA